ncbi:hypothetical protein Tco_0212278 [Tanacetum coccineum]
MKDEELEDAMRKRSYVYNMWVFCNVFGIGDDDVLIVPSTDLRSLYQSRLLWTSQFLMSVRHGELMTICCVVAKPTLKQSFSTPLQLPDTQTILAATEKPFKHHHFKVTYSELASLLSLTIDSKPRPFYPLEASYPT